jgi:hypothetical protein
MKWLFVLAVFVFMIGSGKASAQEFTPGDAPHRGGNNYVACQVGGVYAVVEGQNAPSHRLSADDVQYMKSFCVREALYGGMGEGYWQMPVTEQNMRDARFWVYNERGS